MNVELLKLQQRQLSCRFVVAVNYCIKQEGLDKTAQEKYIKSPEWKLNAAGFACIEGL